MRATAKRILLLSLVALLTILFYGNLRPVDVEKTVYSDTYKNCRKKTKIGFLKAHKCASSSVHNIILRFALNNSLNIVLPSHGNYLGRTTKYQRQMISNTPWERAGLEYDIYSLHSIWNQEEVDRTLGPGATYITMLREPVDQFESLWNYYNFRSFYNYSLEQFAVATKTHSLNRRKQRFLGKNQMLWDMGLASVEMDNITAVQEKINQIDDRFSLVLIAEMFQESMILMKDLLCWDYRDITNLKLNARDTKHRSEMSPATRQALEEYLAADYMLYNHFKEKFTQKLEEFGQQRMEKELDILNHANSNIQKTCGFQATANQKLKGEQRLHGPGLIGYGISNSAAQECRYMTMKENSLLDIQRREQRKRSDITSKMNEENSNSVSQRFLI